MRHLDLEGYLGQRHHGRMVSRLLLVGLFQNETQEKGFRPTSGAPWNSSPLTPGRRVVLYKLSSPGDRNIRSNSVVQDDSRSPKIATLVTNDLAYLERSAKAKGFQDETWASGWEGSKAGPVPIRSPSPSYTGPKAAQSPFGPARNGLRPLICPDRA
jgi:hypothetical protein